MARTEIKRFNNFILYHETGEGINGTPYEDLVVKSIGLAEKHVVEVNLRRVGYKYDGKPVKHLFTGVYVNHGHRGMIDSLAETQEYIDVLKEALDVAFEVQKYCILNGWWAK